MNLLDTAFWITGFVVWIGIALLCLALAAEYVLGFVRAVSLYRWFLRLPRIPGGSLKWRKLPMEFLHAWLKLSHFGEPDATWRHQDSPSYWKGIKNWRIYANYPAEKQGQSA
jgi:hypothetical protein